MLWLIDRTRGDGVCEGSLGLPFSLPTEADSLEVSSARDGEGDERTGSVILVGVGGRSVLGEGVCSDFLRAPAISGRPRTSSRLEREGTEAERPLTE